MINLENLLERNVEKKFGMNKGASIAQGLVALLFGIIISVGVVIPVTDDVVSNSNLTGTAATIVNLLPVCIALIPLGLTFAFF